MTSVELWSLILVLIVFLVPLIGSVIFYYINKDFFKDKP